MTRGGYRKDTQTGLVHQDKPWKMDGASWIEPQGAVVLWDDLLCDVVADDWLINITESGTPTTAAVVVVDAGGPASAGAGGWIGGATQADADDIVEISFGGLSTASTGGIFRPELAGNGMMVMEMGFVIPGALTARQFFCGWGDDPVDGTGTDGPLNIQSAYTITDVATDAAGWIFSSVSTAPTIWKYGSTNNGTQSTASATTIGGTAQIDAYTVCRVEIDYLGNAFFYNSVADIATNAALGRQTPTFRGSNALAVRPTIPLIPMFTVANTAGTAVEWELDYCFAAEARG